LLNLFGKGKAQAKWRSRARLVDPHRTKITLVVGTRPKRLPPWVYRGLQTPHSAERKAAAEISRQ